MLQYTMWMFVHPTHLVLSCATLSNEIFCCPFCQKIMLFVYLPHQQNTYHSATTKVEKLQEANTMLQYTMWMFVHPTHLVLSCATLSNKIFCCSFLIKILFFVCVHQQQNDFFLNHKNRKVVGGKHNILVHYVYVCALDPSGAVLCNPFI